MQNYCFLENSQIKKRFFFRKTTFFQRVQPVSVTSQGHLTHYYV
uniref:Uncharacterized protein n=1 Tax=Siphoviridae sp. ctvuW5 TaxID=2825725 RepID=A0A8S5TX73_9CAUD|nr:MAG TPA: hypothetical protein [Siphoviridae sp. ctvuW5]